MGAMNRPLPWLADESAHTRLDSVD